MRTSVSEGLEEKYAERPVVMTSTMIAPELDAALAELEKQGLTVRLHNAQNNTWHIAKGGLYSGYVVRDHELVYLGRAKKLSFKAIKDLGSASASPTLRTFAVAATIPFDPPRRDP